MKKIIFLIGLMVFLMVGSVFAITPTLVTPATSGTVTGTYTLNSTVAGWDNNDNLVVSYYAYSADTANSSAVAVATKTYNFTTDNGDLNNSFLSTILQDDNSYIFYVEVVNATNTSDNATSTSTSVIVNNTIPSSPTSLTTGAQTARTFTISSTVVDSTTTACSFSWVGNNPLSSGGVIPTATYSGSTCTATVSNAPDYSYEYKLTASDGSDTASQKATFSVDLDSKGGGVSSVTTTTKETTSVQEAAQQTTENISKGANSVISIIVEAFKSVFVAIASLFR